MLSSVRLKVGQVPVLLRDKLIIEKPYKDRQHSSFV